MATEKTPVKGAETTYVPKHKVKQVTPVDDLKIGETRLLSIRQSATSPSKVMIEFAEGVKNPKSGVNIAGLFNKSDERFTSSAITVRRHWQAAEKNDIVELGIGITAEMIAEAERISAQDGVLVIKPAIVNPKVAGERLVIESQDQLAPWDDYQRNNPKATAKQFQPKGWDQPRYFTHLNKDGVRSLIYNRKRLVQESARMDKVILTEPEDRLTWDEFQSSEGAVVGQSSAFDQIRLAERSGEAGDNQ